ncbi:MAG: PTS sugar transporter subunit IIA [Lentisphaeria bacterium]|nr:PTS sugar transporter subunit IIA [Lentisphaeria bacterium]
MDQQDTHFYNFLAKENIIADSGAGSVREVIAELVALLAKNNAGLDAEKITEEVLLREKRMSTAIGSGLAVPHARTGQVDRLLVAMATSRKGIDFLATGTAAGLAHVVILVLTPAAEPGLHLQVLSALANDFREPKVVQELAALDSAEAVLGYFTRAKVELPQFLLARDVMSPVPSTLLENSTLREAIKLFATENADEIPVVDDCGEIRGVVSLADLLKFSLPEHLLWMDDLSFIYRFQPFSEVLSTAGETKVADFMREEYISVEEDIPAVQLAKLFLVHKAQKLFVVKDERTLTGVVELQDFCAKLFWE